MQRRLTPLGSRPELGSHKGYGLAAAVEILSSVLPGACSGKPLGHGEADVGHFFLAIDPQRFREPGRFEDDLDVLIDTLHAATPLDPSQRVLVPGDPEEEAYAQRSRAGIPLSRGVLEDLRAVARASGVPFTLGRRR